MKMWNRNQWWDFLTWFMIAAAVSLFFITMIVLALSILPGKADAQTGGFMFSERESSRPHGEYIIGWNTTGSAILDGTLVMADTMGTTLQAQVAIGKGFKPWTHVTTFGHAQRVLGVLVGTTAGRAQGRIMVLGFHPWVKVDATGITAYTLLRPSLISTTNGAMAAMTAADTTTTTTVGSNMRRPIIGIFQRYANTDSLRAYVWINTLGAVSNS